VKVENFKGVILEVMKMSNEQVGGLLQHTRTDILARFVLACFGNRLGFYDSWLEWFKPRQLHGLLFDSGKSSAEVFLVLSFFELCKQRREVANVKQIKNGQKIFEALYFRCLKPAPGQEFRQAVSINLTTEGMEFSTDIVTDLDFWFDNLGKRCQFPDGISQCIAQASSFLHGALQPIDLAKGIIVQSDENLQRWQNLIGLWPNLEFHFIGLIYCVLEKFVVADLESYLQKVDSEGDEGSLANLFHELKFSSCPAHSSILDAFQEALGWEGAGLRD
jgi:hypothetical protein